LGQELDSLLIRSTSTHCLVLHSSYRGLYRYCWYAVWWERHVWRIPKTG